MRHSGSLLSMPPWAGRGGRADLRRLAWASLMLGLLAAPPLAADLPLEELAGGERAPMPPAERARIRAEIEKEQKAERRREEERLIHEREAAEAIAAARAALPAEVRLLERRCTSCHDAENYTGRTHTRLGWALVVWRMRLLNGAEVTREEGARIAAYLAARQPASLAVAVFEWGATAIVVTAPLAIALLVRRRLARVARRAEFKP